MQSIVITGATGLVGSGLTRLFLSQGSKVTALTRGASDEDARERLKNCLFEQFRIDRVVPPESMEDQLEVLSVDITDAKAMKRLSKHLDADYDAFFHSAACVNFIDEDQCQRVNIEGSRNTIDLVKQLRVKRYNHLSTAFIAGAFKGEIKEDVMPPRETQNAYEDTKYESELLLRRERELPFTVLRPSIIVGSGKDGSIRSFKNFYLIVRYFARLAKRRKPPLRFPGKGDGRINLVPIDYVTRACELIGRKDCERKTYHIVNTAPPTTKEIITAIESALGSPCVQFMGSEMKANEDELATQARFQEFMPYFFGSPSFELKSVKESLPDSLIGDSKLGVGALERLTKYYLQENSKKRT